MRKRKRATTVSEQLRRAIAECGETRYRIAKTTGIPESHLSRFMSGERGFSMATLDLLCRHLGLKLVKVER